MCREVIGPRQETLLCPTHFLPVWSYGIDMKIPQKSRAPSHD